jgi:AcrR family transcriptional regulator
MKDALGDPRQKAILEAAWAAFSTYGYRKTSMDDIAQAAGMSRPALYLHFRNKEDICRSLVRHYYEGAAASVAVALRGDGPLEKVLEAAFAAQGGEIMQVMLTSAHGMEMLDTGTQVAAEEVAGGEQTLCDLYRSWIASGAEAGRMAPVVPPDRMARAITTALKGAKTAATSHDDYRAQLASLARVFAAALTPGR